MIYLEDLYKVMIDFVRNYKQTKFKSQRPQSFAVLDQFSDLEASNLNKTLRDKHKPYFYSRQWEKAHYNKSKLTMEEPLVAVFNRSAPVKAPFEANKRIGYNLEFVVLDTYDRECAMDPSKSKDPYKSRTRNEIYNDAIDMLMELTLFLSEVKYYDIDTDKYKKGLYHPSFIAKYDLAEVATEDPRLTRLFAHTLKQNKEAVIEYWDGGIRELYGAFINIKVDFHRCTNVVYDAETNQILDRGDQGCN